MLPAQQIGKNTRWETGDSSTYGKRHWFDPYLPLPVFILLLLLFVFAALLPGFLRSSISIFYRAFWGLCCTMCPDRKLLTVCEWSAKTKMHKNDFLPKFTLILTSLLVLLANVSKKGVQRLLSPKDKVFQDNLQHDASVIQSFNRKQRKIPGKNWKTQTDVQKNLC